ncbi:MAG: peptidyl-prolyl cis-trans isomerase, partial [Bdellovibrionales bacterium]|nr:peptidyl-prolyl cis-trans isomerase [Bdellovibrionales bacterium]
YERSRSEFMEPKKVRLREMVFSFSEEEPAIPFLESDEDGEAMSELTPEQQARTKADAAFSRLEAGESFADVARDMSEDEATRDSGGDRGMQYYSKLPPEIRTVAERLAVDEHSTPIRVGNSFHLIYVQDAEPQRQQTLDEVRDEIINRMQKLEAPLIAYEAAESTLDEWTNADETQALAAFAEAKSLPVVSSNGLVGERQPGLLPPDVMQRITVMNDGDRELVDVGETSYLVEILETQPSYIPELDEVRDEVVALYRTEQAQKRAREFADSLLSEARAASNSMAEGTDGLQGVLQSVAAAHELSVQQTDAVTRSEAQALPLFQTPGMLSTAFSLSNEQPLAPSVLEGGGKLYVVELKSREVPEDAVTAEERTEVKASAAQQAAGRVFGALVDALKDRTEISINREQLLGAV